MGELKPREKDILGGTKEEWLSYCCQGTPPSMVSYLCIVFMLQERDDYALELAMGDE